ncbi:MAG: cupin domain-containing protein [Acidobacteria bacterium]|nr:cupin domain-containing protein [Acidobacteriota bacterium]
MQVQRWKETEVETLSPTVSRQVIHGEKITMARLVLKKGASVPEHAHHNEQISTMLEGSLFFRIGGKELTLAEGESVVIPANVPHSAEAMEDCVALDVFAPLREDWIRGDDAYLRK